MATRYDVIVLGGGTAGVIAAIAAARGGARTLIIERGGYLGGTAATGLPFLGIYDGQDSRVNAGIPQELVERMKEEDGSLDGCFGATWMDQNYRFSITPFDEETYKYVAQEMVLEAGAELLFHSLVTDVVSADGRLKAVEAANKSGKALYEAEVFIDTTGDADVAWRCGVSMVHKEMRQNASMMFKVGSVDMRRFYEALRNGEGVRGWGEWHNRVLLGPRLDTDEVGPIHMAGHFIGANGQDITFTAVSIVSNVVHLNATRTVGVDGTSASDLTHGEISERRHVHELMHILRTQVPGFEKARLLHTVDIGIRESRNIDGVYLLTMDDVLNGRQFPDSIARGAYPIDIHDPNGGRTQFMFIRNGGSYSIPYRCLQTREIGNLLVAGRCLSATHEAMGSARIMGAAMAQGQAAGTAAALAVRQGCLPGEVDVPLLQKTLREAGAML